MSLKDFCLFFTKNYTWEYFIKSFTRIKTAPWYATTKLSMYLELFAVAIAEQMPIDLKLFH